MANKHKTLVSLFQDVADSIRETGGTTADIVADEFPEKIRTLVVTGSSQSTKISDRFQYSITGVGLVSASDQFTPTCVYYYGGYIFVGGNDSSGCGYVAYSKNFSSWTTVKAHSSRKHPVNALGFDLANGYVYLFGDTSGYGGRSIIRLNDFFNYSTNSYNYQHWEPENKFIDAVTINGIAWALTGTNVTATTNTSGGLKTYTHGSLSHDYIKCCAYNNYPMAISNDGYYTYKSSYSSTTVSGDHLIAENFSSAVCAQLGNYFAVAGTKDDGTYLYYAVGKPGSLKFVWRKVLDEITTPIGLAYANGLYLIAYTYNGNIRFWVSENLEESLSLCNVQVAELDGLTGISTVSTDAVVGLLVPSNGTAKIAAYAVPS